MDDVPYLNPPVSIICGGGSLPFIIAKALEFQNREYLLIGLVGETDIEIEKYRHIWVKWGEYGKLFKALDDFSCRHLMFAGAIVNRPDLKSIRFDFVGLKALPELVSIAVGGDGNVFAGIGKFFEKRGYQIESIVDVVPDVLVSSGCLTKRQPSEQDRRDLILAHRAAYMIGGLDAGQSAVCANERIIALEGPEGTDQMIERCGDIRSQNRARWHKNHAVLVKCPRPGQDMRFDIPTIGPDTISQAILAGIGGIGLSIGEVQILELETVIDRANEAGMFIIGLDPLDVTPIVQD
ncbi:MAG: UDP-2,3-diacylglucosamine diphosphatase LpxI [Cohaesibacteraceae bacterium]|nr:UDP-2,3-diacylglucosamine diphosphatase LpxI [Cohaesibacteraceae bacterium]